MKNRKTILWGAAILIASLTSGIYLLNNSGLWRWQEEALSTELRVGDGATESSLTYDKAVIVFAKERVEFNEQCDIVPNQISIKNGMTVMFDNRSRNATTFKLDYDSSYMIPGYGFKLLQLKSTKLPHVVEVKCGASQNTGKITLK